MSVSAKFYRARHRRPRLVAERTLIGCYGGLLVALALAVWR